MVLPLNFAITLPLAVLIESVNERLKALFRALYFLPVVTSSVGVAVMWGYIFNAQYGLLNKGLKAVDQTPVAWLQDPRVEYLGVPAALLAVIVAYLWQDYGYNLVIFIAALQGIPDSLKGCRAGRRGQSFPGVLAHHDPSAAPHHSFYLGLHDDFLFSGL